VGPTAMAVYNLRRIEGSVSDAQTAEIDEFDVQPDGTESQSGRTLYDRGKWRMERGSAYQIWEAGRLWRFDPGLRRVTFKAAPNGPAMYNLSGFSVRSMIADMTHWNWRQKIEVGDGFFEGKNVSQVTITNSDGAERVQVMADRTTSMPIAFLSESKTVNGWRFSAVARAKFNQPVDTRLFSTTFEPSIPIVDLDRELAQFRTRIQTPLAKFDWFGRTIAIRAVDINPNGHVFLLYTDGETKLDRQRATDHMIAAIRSNELNHANALFVPHPTVDACNSRGGEYLKSGELYPYVSGPSDRFRSGIVLPDGQVLQGAWFIPSESGPWRPIDLTITFNGDRTKMFRQRFEKPSTSLLPDWTSLMGIAPTSEQDVLREELHVRRPALQQKSDFPRLISNVEAELRLMREEESNGIGPWAKGDLYLDLYQAYSGLGDHKIAIHYLKLAANEPYPTPLLTQALAKEQLPN